MNKIIFSILLLTLCGFTILAQSPTPTIIQLQSSGKDILDYILFGIQCLTLISLILYVYKTWEIASANKKSAEISEQSITLSQKSIELSGAVLEEMKASRIQEIAPQVIVFIDMPYESDFVMYLVIKNTGKTIAKNVKINFNPPLITGWSKDNIATELDIPLIADGISSLAPNQEIRTPFDINSTYKEDQLPMVYKVQVRYLSDLQSEEVIAEHTIDLSMFEGLTVLSQKGEEDLIKAVEKIADSQQFAQRHLESISDALFKGIWLKNPEMLSLNKNEILQNWHNIAITKLAEIKLFWLNIHDKKFERRVSHYTKDIQSTISIFSSQTLWISANLPNTISSDIKHSLIEISVRLIELSAKQFYLDGGESIERFNNFGDEIIMLIEDIQQKIENTVEENNKDIVAYNNEQD